MILPFVRELLADLEHSSSFEQARRHLALGRGRRRVSGQTSTARALYIPFFARAANVPVVIVVADNKAADTLQVSLRAGCELTGAIAPERVLKLPAHDVLPFEKSFASSRSAGTAGSNALEDGHRCCFNCDCPPVEAAAMKFFAADYYADLARTLRRGEEIDIDALITHLTSVGYDAADIVEMPGQFTRRGGILDVYSPEVDRPVRVEFFGDEIDSIRKFDPESQRSSTPLDEAILLPLTETPITERLLAAVHARLSGERLDSADDPELLAEAIAASGVSVFPGWEFFSTVAGADKSLLNLFPRSALFVEEPAMIKNQIDRWWNKVEQRHDRSGIGSLIQPDDIYIRPELLLAQLGSHPASISISSAWSTCLKKMRRWARSRSFPVQRCASTAPFQRLSNRCARSCSRKTRLLLVAPNQGEVERLASLLREYEVPYRLGSRIPHAGSETIYDESSYLAGDLRTPILVRSQLANGVSLPEANLVVFGANDFSDEADVTARPAPKKSKTAAFVSDFRDLAVGDYVVHVEHGIARYMGLREIAQDGVNIEFMILEFAEQARLYVPLTRLDLIQKYRSSEAGTAPVLNRLGSQQWAKTKARVKKAMQDMADELLKLYAQRQGSTGRGLFVGQRVPARIRRTPSTTTRRTISSPPSTILSATWNRTCRWIACSAATSATARRK